MVEHVSSGVQVRKMTGMITTFTSKCRVQVRKASGMSTKYTNKCKGTDQKGNWYEYNIH